MNREGGKRLCHAKVKEKDLKKADVRAAARNNREGIFMWTYKYTDELYHYGIPGMKWGHRKRAVASTGGLSGYIRGRQMTNATNNLSAISKRQRQINSELKELRGYEKKPSAIGKTKLATAIRRSQIKSLEKTQSKLQKSKQDNEDALKELKSIDKYQAQKKAERESYKNSPEYKAKQAKNKKVVIAGAAVAGTALAAYGAYKANEWLNSKVAQDYRKKASDHYSKMLKSSNDSRRLSAIADKAKLRGDKKSYNMNMINRNASIEISKAHRGLSDKYTKLSKQNSYSVKEKANYIKKQLKHK